MKLKGTARGSNIREVIEDAERQTKEFYGERLATEILFGDAYPSNIETWGEVVRNGFEASFEATPKGETKP